ncbi:hypothetical protein [Streptomyces coeruleorubidus]|uniref:hypothetical protein n=1 Tax=Streptomyces coeruleorubidus TaxID=116188 RepID=UPI00365B0FFC
MWLVRLAPRLGLFLAAYAPLALIFAVRSVEAGKWSWEALFPGATTWTAIALIGFISLHGFLKSASSLGSQEITVDNVQDLGPEVSGYLATYLLPFIAPTLSGWQNIASYATYFLILFVIFNRSDLELVNPTLYLFGRRIFRAQLITIDDQGSVTEVEDGALIISRSKPIDKQGFPAITISGIYIAKRT